MRACCMVQRLGIHVVEYNCYDLVNQSEGKAAAALAAAFETASNFSPAVLLLRRFGAFSRFGGAMGTNMETGAFCQRSIFNHAFVQKY